MTNPFYAHSSGVPATQSRGLSSLVRAEFDTIEDGFDIVDTSIDGIVAGTTPFTGGIQVKTIAIDANGVSETSLVVGSAQSAIVSGGAGAAYNSAFGVGALVALTTGDYNTGIGGLSLGAITTGGNNTAAGYNALSSNTASGNTAVGLGAGYGPGGVGANTTGQNNSFLGVNAIGSSATASNEITLGNSSIATLRCQVTSITALSDARDKTAISDLSFGLDFLDSLRPVAFTWNARDGSKVGIRSSGFLAQDLKSAQEAWGASEVLRLVYEENPEKLEANYGHLIPVLVKALQELKAEVDSLRSQLIG